MDALLSVQFISVPATQKTTVAFTTLPGSASAATTFQGTEGADSVVIIDLPNASTNFEANGEGGDDFIAFEGSQNLSTIRGGQGNDLITQNILTDDFFGNIWSAGLISGNMGDDVIGNNQLGIAAIASTINGGQGDDQLYVGPIQSTLLNGNLGNDWVIVDGDYGSVNINGSSIFGGQGDDYISVDSDRNDNINNTVIGGNLGNDYITLDVDASFAGSVVEGGDGDDYIFAGRSSTGLLIFGGEGNDYIVGAGGDYFGDYGAGDDIFGEAGNDYIKGLGGNDFLVGGDGADSLFGGYGRDTLLGGDLNDILVGGEDADILSGGTGSNQFRYNSSDTADGSFVNVSVGGNIYTIGVELEDTRVDIITDWDAAAGTNVIANNVNVFDPGVVLTDFAGGQGVFSVNFNDNQNYAIRGSYNADLDNFTFNSGGSDVLIGTAQDEGPFLAGPDGYTNNLVVLTNVAFTTTFSQANFI
ncbi:calcium-binding protein [Synechococcus sp. CCY9202]|uniref:calcium-binding protein n=1 Tax=Synechococcus sp. CCY9202 TaxID=174698 RepID=UPI002B1F21B5|nr:calcium-binding protein [Synechococcus sp. CCY9202]MEA5423138.1 calcium-binding protein [Synechococcus sp. CCY9202]